jgi:hypothetical protein
MCERANKGSGKHITAKADTCKRGERGRSPTGKGLPWKAGMITKSKNTLPRENLVTRLDKITSYGVASVRVGRPSDPRNCCSQLPQTAATSARSVDHIDNRGST